MFDRMVSGRRAKAPTPPSKPANSNRAPSPFCPRLLRAKTIEMDRNVNIPAIEVLYESFKALPPVVAQNGAATFSIFCRTLVRPGMYFENACLLRAAISENLVWPPALKIPAAPDCDVLPVGKFQRAIH